MITVEQTARQLRAETIDGVQMAKDCEYAGRNCYASHDRITEDSYDGFQRRQLTRGHNTPQEFGDLTFDITTSRAVMAELTRHRQASFCIESQRYIQEAKSGDITFVYPVWEQIPDDVVIENAQNIWKASMKQAEDYYKALISSKMQPQQAREVLPNSTACRIIMKANLREWRHFFTLRCAKAAYPAMRYLALDMLKQAHDAVPAVFDDLYEEFIERKGE